MTRATANRRRRPITAEMANTFARLTEPHALAATEMWMDSIAANFAADLRAALPDTRQNGKREKSSSLSVNDIDNR